MDRTRVFEEVKQMVETGIFFSLYTHVSSDVNRPGIERTRKIMSIGTALANGVVPFSGESTASEEFAPYSFLFRYFNVSLSQNGSSNHGWKDYICYGASVWTQEVSDKMIAKMIKTIKNRRDLPPEIIANIEQCIEFECLRQRKYERMELDEKKMLLNPKPEVYTFERDIGMLAEREAAMRKKNGWITITPTVPAEVDLETYLSGMFTTNDVDETKQWVQGIIQRKIPVASLDSFFLWDTIMPRLPSYRELPNPVGYIAKINENYEFKARVIREAQRLSIRVLKEDRV